MRRCSLLVAGWSLLAALSAPGQARAEPAGRQSGPPLSLAIIVGSNRGPSPAQDSLRFGDDDAIQNARTLSQLGVRTTLLVDPDAETRELFPTARPQGPATRVALGKAFKQAAAEAAVAHAAGRKTRVYFLFAGHGDLADGRPFLQLDDGRLWREDLAELLASVDADDNHVLVDACYASAFVADRGPGGQRDRIAPGFSQASDDIWPEQTGFLTARSSGGQTHEWAEYQAGIFSHELRSGLMGAADVNLDGKVTYREIAAFVQRANEAIPNRRYRPEVSTAPPGGDLDRSLADLPDGPLVLEMDVKPTGHAFVETGKGIRLADLHPASGATVYLRLPTDLGDLFVQQGRDGGAPAGGRGMPESAREFLVVARKGRLRLSSLVAAAPRVRARGAAHEAFLMLFTRPFDETVVQGYHLDPDLVAHHESPAARQRKAAGKTVLTIAAVAGVAGVTCAGTAAFIKYADSPTNSMADTAARNRWINRLNISAWSLGAAAVLAAGTGTALLLWPDHPPPIGIAPLPHGGAAVAYQTRF